MPFLPDVWCLLHSRATQITLQPAPNAPYANAKIFVQHQALDVHIVEFKTLEVTILSKQLLISVVNVVTEF